MGNSKKTIIVKTESGNVTVRKLALGDYAELLKAFKKLPEEIGKFVEGKDKDELSKMSNASVATAAFDIAPKALEEFCEVLAVPTDKDKDFFMKETDLADAIDVLVAIFELNDYKRITKSVKKLMPQSPAPQDKKTKQVKA